jgi:hypothetical protein
MPPTSNPFTNNLPGLVLLILLLAVPLAFLTSVILLKLYQRAVLRWMRKRATVQPADYTPPDSSGMPHEPVEIPLNISILDSVSNVAAHPDTARLYADLIRAPWRVAAMYAIAGLCYALVTTIIFLAATNIGFDLLSFMIIFWYYAWPVVITVCLVAAATWRTRLIFFVIYFFIIFTLGAIATVSNSFSNWTQIILLWFLTNFPAAILLLTFLNRRVQAVGPFALTFMIFAVTGVVVLPPLVINNARLISLIVDIGLALGLGAFGIYIALLILGFVSFGAIGWFILQWIGDLYKRKKISEQSITLDAIWLLFGIFQSMGLIFEGEGWFLASLLAFFVYKIVSWLGFFLLSLKTPSSQRSPSLLLLRVFSLGKRSERLFNALEVHWRYVGSIRLIAGPDLATTTMEPHEFLEFLSGKLARRFIDSAQTFEQRLAETDVQPDPDGQFRVNDFFCYADTWRMVLSRLAEGSDVVLMDLRGFSSQNAGVVFEIGELIDLVPLERIVFIIDDTTDQPFLRQVLQQAWERMRLSSPNRRLTSGLLPLLRLRDIGHRELQQYLYALSAAAVIARQPETSMKLK